MAIRIWPSSSAGQRIPGGDAWLHGTRPARRGESAKRGGSVTRSRECCWPAAGRAPRLAACGDFSSLSPSPLRRSAAPAPPTTLRATGRKPPKSAARLVAGGPRLAGVRDPPRARRDHLLARPGRLGRAAELRFLRLGQSRPRRAGLSGADAHRRARRLGSLRLYSAASSSRSPSRRAIRRSRSTLALIATTRCAKKSACRPRRT